MKGGAMCCFSLLLCKIKEASFWLSNVKFVTLLGILYFNKPLIVNKQDVCFIEQLQKGSEEAYTQLFEMYHEELCNYANQYVQDNYIARSVVLDVLFHFWETRHQWCICQSLKGYLLKAVHNKCLDIVKAQRTQRTLLKKCELQEIEQQLECIESPDYALNNLIADELRHSLQIAINTLSPECRRVFMLSRVEGKKNKEIAEQLDISINTVKYHLKQALKRLNLAR